METHNVNADFATEIAPAGDVNGDGFDDVLIGAPNYDHVEIGEGGVQLYLGTTTGLTLEPGWGIEANQFSAHLGSAVTTLGDVNLDGYDDIAIGASSYSETFEYGGAVVVFSGGPGANPGAP
jgi:hypothetical protein